MATLKKALKHPVEPTRDSMDFKYLPEYAGFLLANHHKAFAKAMLDVSREIDVPLLRFFSQLSDDELLQISMPGTAELLEHFSKNKVQAYIEKSLDNWQTNQLPLISSSDIVAADINYISFVRRKCFRDFFKYYSTDLDVYIRIMEEVDRFTIKVEEACYQILFDMQQKQISEHNYLLDKINNTSPGIIYVFDLVDRKEIYSNYKREAILGYSTDEIKDLSLADLVHPDDLPEVIKHLNAFRGMPDGEMIMHESRSRHKNGKYIWMRNYEAVFKRDDDGTPSQIIGISINVSKEKEITLQLEQREAQLREAQEIAGLGTFDWDIHGGESFYSPQLIKIFELEGKGSLERHLQYVHPSDRKMIADAVTGAINGTGGYEVEYRYKKGNDEKIVWSRARVIHVNGVPARLRGTVMDVTKRHDMLKRLERSEEMHKQAQALTHLGNWSWYIPDNKITWSDELYRIYGLEAQSENITWERFMKFIHPDDRAKRQAEIERAMKTLVAEDYTMRIVLDNGQIKYLQGRGEVLADEFNIAYKLVGTCQDITEQYLLNAQLRESEETFRDLIYNAPDAVIVMNEKDEVLLWNPKAQQLFGWSEEEVTGRKLSDTLFTVKDGKDHSGAFNASHLIALNKTVEVTARNKNNKELYIALSAAESFQRGQKVRISFIRDISKEKIADMELEKSRNELAEKNLELERRNQELMSFNYIASHDLKEPVRKVKLFTNRILEDNSVKLADSTRGFANRIMVASNQMQTLIDALFSFSKASAIEGILEIIQPDEHINEVITTLNDIIEEKHAVIHVQHFHPLRFIRFQFAQLIENLISNALKYSRTDVHPVIDISWTNVSAAGLKDKHPTVIPNTNYLVIKVADNGIGFDQQYAQRIFELFQRLHGKHEYTGTGIGLAICKKIVENHNGFIYAESRPGEGAAFYVCLPDRV